MVGEKRDFALKIKGYGADCGTPNMVIINQKSGTTVYTIYNYAIFSCSPGLITVDDTWSLKDLDAPPNLTISEAGNYKVTGTYHGSETTKNIEVSMMP